MKDFYSLGRSSRHRWKAITLTGIITLLFSFTLFSQISTFPYLEDFGTNSNLPAGWVVSTSSNPEWDLDYNGTTSTGTGPEQDHTNPGSGYYAFMETSSPADEGDTSSIMGPVLDLTSISNPYVEFWYHMYGSSMGKLEFQVYDKGAWTTLWSMEGQQHTSDLDAWTSAKVFLGKYAGSKIYFRFLGTTGTSYYSDMAIDDVKFDDLKNNDLDIAGITSPVVLAFGDNTVTIELENNGKAINSGDIYLQYKVDNGSWVEDTMTIKSSFNPFSRTTFTFTKKWNISAKGTYTLTARINPQLTGDPDTNDEYSIEKCTPVSDTMYIDPTGKGDFSTIDSAVMKLERCGCGDDVIFMVTQGTYNEQIFIGEIVGVGPNSTVTFDGGADSSKTILTHTGTASNYATLTLDGADYITFKNMTIQNTSSTDGWCVHLTNQANNNSFMNTVLDITSTGSYDLMGIVASASPTSETSEGDNANYITVKNSRFVNGEENLHFEGESEDTPSKGLYIYSSSFSGAQDESIKTDNVTDIIIKDNKINSDDDALYLYDLSNVQIENNIIVAYYYGMYLYDGPDVNVYNNDITTTGSYGDGIYANDLDNFMIERNKIQTNDYGIYLNDANLNTSSRSGVINNMVISSSDYGIYVYDAKNVDIWFNSVIGEPAIRLYTYSGPLTGLDVRNNIFQSNGDYAFEADDAANFDALDYNMYYGGGTDFVDYLGTDYASLKAWKNAEPTINEYSLEQKPDFVSGTNLHLSSNAALPLGTVISSVDLDIDGDKRCPFAATMGADEYNHPVVMPTAAFTAPDSVGVNSPVKFLNNASANDPKFHFWYVNDVFQTNDLNMEYTFKSVGEDTVKLVTANCTGYDTLIKVVKVFAPTVVPVSNFISDKNVIEVYESVNFSDISENYPSDWEWTISPDSVIDASGFKIPTYTMNNGIGVKNPNVTFNYPGSYTICLTASNAAGTGNTKCKTDYIEVKSSVSLCTFDTVSKANNGNLFDNGGPSGDYGENLNCNYLINPCASEVTLFFNEFDIGSGDYLRIYDGLNSDGKPLWNVQAFGNNGITNTDRNDPDFDTIYTATSGAIYIEFETDAITEKSGFIAEWSSTPGVFAKPTAKFDAPDSVCLGLPVTFENQSTGDNNEYFWDFDGDGFIDDNTENGTYRFLFNQTETVKLTVRNCGGEDTYTKQVVVYSPTTAPKIDFAASNTEPIAEKEAVHFDAKALSHCINSGSWTITPASYRLVSGNMSTAEPISVIFQDTVTYDVQLVAGFDTYLDTLTKMKYIKPIAYCNPVAANKNADIGITRVMLETIDQSSTAGISEYSDYSETQSASLQQGAQYTITVERKSNYNPISRKVWIDYNIDGIFDESTELVDSNFANTLSWTTTFTVPSYAKIGSTIMRVGASDNANQNSACGPNNFGEFEDYRIYITADATPPVITLVGSDTMHIEQCDAATGIPGAKAMDNVDGDITADIVVDGSYDFTTPGEYHITYNVSDAQGNAADEVVRTVIVTADAVAPELTLKGDNPDYVHVSATYTDPGYDAVDTCSGMDTVMISGMVNTNEVGVYQLTYTATDLAGNSVDAIREVHVQDTVKPEITTAADDTLYVDVLEMLVEPVLNITDNYYTDFNIEASGSFYDNFPNGVPTQLGTYDLMYKVTDASGNENSITFTVISVDEVAPTIQLVGPSLVKLCRFDSLDDQGVVVKDNFDENPVVTKGGTYMDEYMVEFANGFYELIYTVKDQSGNFATVSRFIDVSDEGNCASSIASDEISDNIVVYPNPNKGQFVIDLSMTTLDQADIRIYDMVGNLIKVVEEGNSLQNQYRVDMSENAAGIYFINISNNNNSVMMKVNLVK